MNNNQGNMGGGNQGNNGNKPGKRSKQPKMQTPFWRNVWGSLFIFALIIFSYSLIVDNSSKDKDITLSELATNIEAGSVTSLVVKGDSVTVKNKDNTETTVHKEDSTPLTQTLSDWACRKINSQR